MSRAPGLTEIERDRFRRLLAEGLAKYDLSSADAMDHGGCLAVRFEGRRMRYNFQRNVAERYPQLACPCGLRRESLNALNSKTRPSGQFIRNALRPDEYPLSYRAALDVLNYVDRCTKALAWRASNARVLDRWHVASIKMRLDFMRKAGFVKPDCGAFGTPAQKTLSDAP